ncbi:MAG: hypothetical protein CMO01_03130 [Thalassobius sp.]|nr:hypothetical protein [Thalassovita sp.]
MVFTSIYASAQQAYFVDGYHGGVYGHFPEWQTRFMVDQLNAHPDWKISLEIEPETWDSVQVYDHDAYTTFQKEMADPAFKSRIDIVNPSYGQAYLYNISGESIIRQFELGIRKMRQHFPSFTYTTYSTEEPCFTSALPQILKSFGFKYAVLKNPNTCWGGYTRAFGGETIQWIGPDGTAIKTVPRYESEAFEENSTWQTQAWGNAVSYIEASLQQGIKHPVGMCLQDAGWNGGPWLGVAQPTYLPSTYVTWTEYLNDIATAEPSGKWRMSQEDIQVSLVWGAQVLQRLAQQVRVSENKLTVAEKITAFKKANKGTSWPQNNFDEAWRTLLLSQHHDCWIVPYNGKEGDTWADKVVVWTGSTNSISDSLINLSMNSSNDVVKSQTLYVQVFNSQAIPRTDIVKVDLPKHLNENLVVFDEKGNEIPSQQVTNPQDQKQLLFNAKAKPLGISTFEVKTSRKNPKNKVKTRKTEDGLYYVETEQYSLKLDPSRGGVVTSLLAKNLEGKELVDTNSERALNEVRGFFYDQNKFISSTDKPAKIEVVESGAILEKLAIKGHIGEHPFTQFITLYQKERRIEFEIEIDWQGSPGIGKYSQMETYEAKDPEKAFYNDEYKLLVHFPLDMENQQVYKNAPFDVTKSNLGSTFFNRWDSIKNNVILNWVDVLDEDENVGVALFTDHTTSYAHAKDHPLALNIQYSGSALWGRNYSIDGKTQVKYALVPHIEKWNKAGIWMESVNWNEPLVASISNSKPNLKNENSLIQFEDTGWELTALQYKENDLQIRIFNAEGTDEIREIKIHGEFKSAALIELNGQAVKELEVKKSINNTVISIAIPPFGIRTISLRDFNYQSNIQEK